MSEPHCHKMNPRTQKGIICMTIIVICYVAVDGIAFVATFYKSYFSLILSQLLSESNPLSLGFDSAFYSDWGTLFCQCFPRRCGRHIVRSDFFAKVASHSFCHSSFPNRTRCRWAPDWFLFYCKARFAPSKLGWHLRYAVANCNICSRYLLRIFDNISI